MNCRCDFRQPILAGLGAGGDAAEAGHGPDQGDGQERHHVPRGRHVRSDRDGGPHLRRPAGQKEGRELVPRLGALPLLGTRQGNKSTSIPPSHGGNFNLL